VEELGGMTEAIEAGIPIRIEEAAARKQARIDSGQDIIVGVNKYRLETEDPLNFRCRQPNGARKQQLEQLDHIKATRDNKSARIFNN
jgi:methylmalonyl-CoA mutase